MTRLACLSAVLALIALAWQLGYEAGVAQR